MNARANAKVRRRMYRIHARDGWRCAWCERPVIWCRPADGEQWPDDAATADHLIPRSKGGTNEQHNLVTACRQCNRERGDMSVEEWLQFRQGVEAAE